MKYNLVFGPGDFKWFTTNYSRAPLDFYADKANGQVNIVSYSLNNHDLTVRWIEEYLRIREETWNDNVVNQYNYYPSLSIEMSQNARRELNNSIVALREFDIVFPDEMKVNEVDVVDAEWDKLEAIHALFSKYQFELTSVDTDHDSQYWDKFNLLEKINNITHFIKRTPENPDNWKEIDKYVDFNMSIRNELLSSTNSEYYKLEPADYGHFTVPTAGDLVADFSTVGKDLWHCQLTNDMETVRQGNVKQQRILTDFVFCHFHNSEDPPNVHDISRNDFYKWCNANKVEEYYDYMHATFIPGRHVLGRVDGDLQTGKKFYEQVVSKTPILMGTYLSDDYGNPL